MTARAALVALALALALPGCHARKTAAEIPAKAPAAPISISDESIRGASPEAPPEAEASKGVTSSSAAAGSPSGGGSRAAANVASPGASAPTSTATATGGGAAGFAWGEPGTAPADVPEGDGPAREARSRSVPVADDGGETPARAPAGDSEEEAPAAYPAAVWAVARPAAVPRGATMEIDLRIADARDVLGAPCHVVFDPAVLAFREAREGPFLRESGGRGTAFLAAPVDEGRIALGLSLLGPGSGASGEGVLATLVFEAVGEGAARVEFERARLASATKNQAAARFTGALVVVSGTMLGSR